MKWDVQVRHSVAKENRMLGLIRKSFKFLEKHNTTLLYKSLIRPRLEYVISSWSPYCVKDINELEKVQRRATRMVPELRGFSYAHSLNKMDLTNLQIRKRRDDFIQMFKIINNLEKVNTVNDACLNAQNRKNNLRSHNRSIYRDKMRYFQPRFNFLTNIVTTISNKLPTNIVNARSLNSFKEKLDVWMKANFC